MRISSVQAFHCDAGWRPRTFVKVTTDAGLVGWGECSDSRNPLGVAGCVRDLESILVGEDPRPIGRLYWDMLRMFRQNLGGTSHKAIAGIELALWDIKAKAPGVPVYELFGGPTRAAVPLYWSHCGTTRARHGDKLGPPRTNATRHTIITATWRTSTPYICARRCRMYGSWRSTSTMCRGKARW